MHGTGRTQSFDPCDRLSRWRKHLRRSRWIWACALMLCLLAFAATRTHVSAQAPPKPPSGMGSNSAAGMPPVYDAQKRPITAGGIVESVPVGHFQRGGEFGIGLQFATVQEV